MLWKTCNTLTGQQTWWRSGGNGDECSGSAGDRRTSTDGGGSIVSTCNIIKKNQDKQKIELTDNSANLDLPGFIKNYQFLVDIYIATIYKCLYG